MRLLFLMTILSLLLFSCKKYERTPEIYIQHFKITDTSWRLLIDKYHPDHLPKMESMYIENCTIFLDSSYCNKNLFFFIKDYYEIGIKGLYTGPIIFDDTIIIDNTTMPVDIKDYINPNELSLSGKIGVKDAELNFIHCKMIKFTGDIRIEYIPY